MRRIVVFFFLLSALFASTPAADTFLVLCYHDVRDDVKGHYDPDAMAVSTRRLIDHFAWLQDHGYHAVSIDDILAARNGTRPLPEKAVLITFDDGLKSVYTRVYPALQLFNYPAVIGLMGRWMEGGKRLNVPYGHRNLGAADFLTWKQVKEMAGSGLVEFASHSYDLHHGVIANPQGNEQPAPTARIYDPAAQRYEDDAAYKKRIRADLKKNVRLIKKHLGKAPRVMVWPYGKFNRTTIDIAGSLGMPITLTLDPKPNGVRGLDAVGRILIMNNPGPADLTWILRHPAEETDPLRVVHVDLDYLYDKDQTQQAKNLDILLERIKRMKINRVFLQAFADPDGDGTADALYFPNRHLPVRADLFNRTAWQLKTRSEVKVYAWMPVTAFHLPGAGDADDVRAAGKGGRTPPSFKRLSVFSSTVRATVLEIYEDLAKHADFDGLLFHDDAFLSDFEDASPAALKHYQREWDLPPDVPRIRADPERFKKWTAHKTAFLVDFTRRLKERAERFRAPLKTARNIYARPVLEPKSSAWFAQSYPLFLQNYDYTAIMAMPYLENAKNPQRWLKRLVRAAAQMDPKLERTIFELQSKDWRTQKDIPAAVLVKQMELLQLNGAMNYGYYPDDFIRGLPHLETIRLGISLQTYPYRKR